MKFTRWLSSVSLPGENLGRIAAFRAIINLHPTLAADRNMRNEIFRHIARQFIITIVILFAAHIHAQSNIVSLSYGTFQGATSGNTTSFLGMPFAQPPLGALRFAPPLPPLATPVTEVQNATSFGAACPQQSVSMLNVPGFDISGLLSAFAAQNASEDCLFVNVVKPAVVEPGTTLPVLFWIFGGGFEDGDTSFTSGDTLVERSIAINEPVIYVSANYRLNAFGFLASKEVLEEGSTNVGIRDQRLALQWVQQHISAFGGDPNRVIIWGESAGAISVGLHLFINDGSTGGLFRGAVMESGSPFTRSNVSAGQPYYDQLVAYTGCTTSYDTLDCLRSVPYEQLLAAIDSTPNIFSYSSVDLAWEPRVDGIFLTDSPQNLITKGLYAKVPIITGDCDDEGTLFALPALNLTTDEDFLGYIQEFFLPGANETQLTAIGIAYPQDPTQGSPFDTGDENSIAPQYKRLAAFLGDGTFQSRRRSVLQAFSKTQNTYAFLWKRGKATPDLGSFHTSDIAEFYGTVDDFGQEPDFVGTDAIVNFAYNLDPNVGNGGLPVTWPLWNSSTTAPPLLTFFDPAVVNITADNYRWDAMNLLIELEALLSD